MDSKDVRKSTVVAVAKDLYLGTFAQIMREAITSEGRNKGATQIMMKSHTLPEDFANLAKTVAQVYDSLDSQ